MGPMILGIQQVSRILAFAPDAGKSLKSAARVFELQDRLPAIDAYSSKGDKPSPVGWILFVRITSSVIMSANNVALLFFGILQKTKEFKRI